MYMIRIYKKLLQLNNTKGTFPGGAGVKNPPASAGDGFDPRSGKIPYAMEQLNPCATTTEPAL